MLTRYERFIVLEVEIRGGLLNVADSGLAGFFGLGLLGWVVGGFACGVSVVPTAQHSFRLANVSSLIDRRRHKIFLTCANFLVFLPTPMMPDL